MNTKLFTLSILAIFLVSLTSATVELGGQAGKDVLTGLGNGGGLWNWGEAPLGHIIKDSKLIAGAWIMPDDRSSMQTPLQANGIGEGGLANDPDVNEISFDDTYIPIIFGGYLTLPISYRGDLGQKGAKGIFDIRCFKAPNENEFPRVYGAA
ncbi:MAG: hypothetical protein PHQ34_14995 [Methanothrix sp.]|nr:hypothetical protein [Methanothrix sp.]